MASSRKSGARSARPRKSPTPKSLTPAKPFSFAPKRLGECSVSELGAQLVMSCAILSECHALIVPCMRLLGGDDKKRADFLLMNISQHLRAVTDLVGTIPTVPPLSDDASEAKGGVA